MAQTVVDTLEVIQVQQQHCQLSLGMAHVFDAPVELMLQHCPVAQSRQTVMGRLPLKAQVGAFQCSGAPSDHLSELDRAHQHGSRQGAGSRSCQHHHQPCRQACGTEKGVLLYRGNRKLPASPWNTNGSGHRGLGKWLGAAQQGLGLTSHWVGTPKMIGKPLLFQAVELTKALHRIQKHHRTHKSPETLTALLVCEEQGVATHESWPTLP